MKKITALLFYVLLSFVFSAALFSAENITIGNANIKCFLSPNDLRFGADIGDMDKTLTKNVIFNKPGFTHTSYLSIKYGGRVYIFGGKHGKKSILKKSKSSIISAWRIKKLSVIQSLLLTKAEGYNTAAALMIKYRFKNNGSNTIKIGARMLLDTELDTTFYFDNGDSLDKQLSFQNDNRPHSILFAKIKAKNQILAKLSVPIENNIQPNEIVASDWLSAYTNPLHFNLLKNIGFNYKNVLYEDAALSFYWDTLVIPAGKSLNISLLLSKAHYTKIDKNNVLLLLNTKVSPDKKHIITNCFLLNKTNSPLGPTILDFSFNKGIGAASTPEKIFFSSVEPNKKSLVSWRFTPKKYGLATGIFNFKTIISGKETTINKRMPFFLKPPYYEKLLYLKKKIKNNMQKIERLSSGFAKYPDIAFLKKQYTGIERNLELENYKNAFRLAKNADSLSRRLLKKAAARKKRFEKLTALSKKYQKNNDLGKLKDVYQELSLLKPNSPAILKLLRHVSELEQISQLYKSANDFMIYQSYDEAKDIYTAILNIDTNQPNALYNLGMCYFYKNKYDTAVKYYKSALRIDPHLYLAYHQLGIISIYDNSYDSAVFYLKKVLHLKPDYKKAQVLLNSIKE